MRDGRQREESTNTVIYKHTNSDINRKTDREHSLLVLIVASSDIHLSNYYTQAMNLRHSLLTKNLISVNTEHFTHKAHNFNANNGILLICASLSTLLNFPNDFTS